MLSLLAAVFILICYGPTLCGCEDQVPKLLGYSRYPKISDRQGAVYQATKACLMCNFNSNVSLTVAWFKNGKSISYDNRIKTHGCRKWSGNGMICQFCIETLQANDTGSYKCTGSNKHGQGDSATFSLRVISFYKPMIDKNSLPDKVVLYKGQSVRLDCIADGYPTVEKYKWRKKSGSINGNSVQTVKNGLFFSDALTSQAGEYICNAENSQGKDSKSVHVSVVNDPSWEIRPTNLTMDADSKFSLSGSFYGSLKDIKITWYQNNKELPAEMILRDGKVGQPHIVTYTVLSAQARHNGRYVLEIRNKNGKITSAVDVYVSAKPDVVINEGSELTATVGQVIEITCEAQGHPTPSVTWNNDGRLLAKTSLGPNHRSHIKSSLTHLIYPVVGVKTYVCIGENDKGSDMKSITIVTKGRSVVANNNATKQRSNDGNKQSSNDANKLANNDANKPANNDANKPANNDANIQANIDANKPANNDANKLANNDANIQTNNDVNKQTKDNADSKITIIILAISAVVIILVILVMICIIKYRRGKRENPRLFQDPAKKAVIFTTSAHYKGGNTGDRSVLIEVEPLYITPNAPIYPLKPKQNEKGFQKSPTKMRSYNETFRRADSVDRPYCVILPTSQGRLLSYEDLNFGEQCGSGQFGNVVKGTLNEENSEPKEVAIKMLKDNAGLAERKMMLDELKIMKALSHHPNVIALIGWVITDDNVYIVEELVTNGSLLQLLRSERLSFQRTYVNIGDSMSEKDALTFAWQVASGMKYLSSQDIVHRDLAARNILLGQENICKIADFGLARQVYRNTSYTKTTAGELPLRWMAYESVFNGVYTSASDVWSFGVLLWEIISLGDIPYSELPNTCVVIQHLKDQKRMEKPVHISDELYHLMTQCWSQLPSMRPDFADLTNKLGQMLFDKNCHINYSGPGSNFEVQDDLEEEEDPDDDQYIQDECHLIIGDDVAV